jgi:tetratricopeptide (TPR) repeat protein
MQRNQPEEAMALADELVASNPSSHTGYYLKGCIELNMLKNYVAARESFGKAIELNPKNLDLLRGLSDSYAAGNDFAKAAYYYQKVIDSNEYVANDLFEAGVAYYNHAVTAEDPAVKADALNKARNFLVQVNVKVPGNVRIVNQMAAIEKVAEGEKITGKATPIYKQLIELLDAKEDKSGYESFYRRAYNYLANVAFNNGDKETAKEYYKKWLEYDPDNEALRKYVESLK